MKTIILIELFDWLAEWQKWNNTRDGKEIILPKKIVYDNEVWFLEEKKNFENDIVYKTYITSDRILTMDTNTGELLNEVIILDDRFYINRKEN